MSELARWMEEKGTNSAEGCQKNNKGSTLKNDQRTTKCRPWKTAYGQQSDNHEFKYWHTQSQNLLLGLPTYFCLFSNESQQK